MTKNGLFSVFKYPVQHANKFLLCYHSEDMIHAMIFSMLNIWWPGCIIQDLFLFLCAVLPSGLMKALQKGKTSPDLSLTVPVGKILLYICFSSSKNLQFLRAFPICCKKKEALMTELRELGSQAWVSTNTRGLALLAASSFQSHSCSYPC